MKFSHRHDGLSPRIFRDFPLTKIRSRIPAMKKTILPARTEAEIWLRILHPEMELKPKVARIILGLRIPDNDVVRMRELSAKARDGTLTASEDQEMNEFERVGSILSILKSKARQALRRSKRSA